MDEKKEEKKVLGGDIIKLIITTCRPYFATDEELIKDINSKLNKEEKYTIEEIKEIVVGLTTNEQGKRKRIVRRYKTANEIAQDWKPSKDKGYRH